jgi:hypothetical protein
MRALRELLLPARGGACEQNRGAATAVGSDVDVRKFAARARSAFWAPASVTTVSLMLLLLLLLGCSGYDVDGHCCTATHSPFKAPRTKFLTSHGLCSSSATHLSQHPRVLVAAIAFSIWSPTRQLDSTFNQFHNRSYDLT